MTIYEVLFAAIGFGIGVVVTLVWLLAGDDPCYHDGP